MKRKILFVIIAVIATIAMLGCLAACGPKVEPQTGLGWAHPTNYTEGAVQKDMNSVDLFKQAVENFKNTTNAQMTEYLFFDGTAPLGIKAQQTELTVTKIVDNKLLVTRAAKGLDGNTNKKSALEKFYFDGTNAYNYYLQDVSLKDIDIEKPDFTGLSFTAYDGDAAEKVATCKNIFSYVVSDSNLSANNDNNVYKIQNTYYGAITLKTDKGLNAEVESVLYENTGADENSLEFTAETVIYFAVEEVNGVMSFVGYEMVENYKFKQGMPTVDVVQNFSGKFVYGNVTISDSELLPIA